MASGKYGTDILIDGCDSAWTDASGGKVNVTVETTDKLQGTGSAKFADALVVAPAHYWPITTLLRWIFQPAMRFNSGSRPTSRGERES